MTTSSFLFFIFFFSSRRRHTRLQGDWSSDVCSSDLYTVMLPGSVENTPGADRNSVKDSEGTVQQDKDTGKKIEEGAKGGVYGASGGALAGGLSSGINGARVGAAAGAAVGIGWALHM